MIDDRLPLPGQIARVRSRRYLVESVARPETSGRDTLVSLSCIDDDSAGDALRVLWEKEVDAEVLKEEGWSRIGDRGFDAQGQRVWGPEAGGYVFRRVKDAAVAGPSRD